MIMGLVQIVENQSKVAAIDTLRYLFTFYSPS